MIVSPPYQVLSIHDDSQVPPSPHVNAVAEGIACVDGKVVIIGKVRWNRAMPSADEVVIEADQFFGKWWRTGDESVINRHGLDVVGGLNTKVCGLC